MRKALVLGVAAIALIAFSGLAVGDIWYMHYVEYNTKGWKDCGTIGHYHVLSKLNYREKQVYSMNYDWIYLSYHYIHSNWDLKYLDGDKPVTITHYNCIFRYKAEIVDSAGTLKWSEKANGYFRIIDPQASNLNWGDGHGQPPPTWDMWWWWGIQQVTPIITKWNDQRPIIEDAVKLTEMIFNNFDYTLLPLIKYIEFRDINGNSIQIDVDMH